MARGCPGVLVGRVGTVVGSRARMAVEELVRGCRGGQALRDGHAVLGDQGVLLDLLDLADNNLKKRLGF